MSVSDGTVNKAKEGGKSNGQNPGDKQNGRKSKGSRNSFRECLQCSLSGMRCSRIINQVTTCGRCKRIGELCLVPQDSPPEGRGFAFQAAGGDTCGLQPEDVERLAFEKIEEYRGPHSGFVVQGNRWVPKPGRSGFSVPVWNLEEGGAGSPAAGLVVAQTGNFALPDWIPTLYSDDSGKEETLQGGKKTSTSTSGAAGEAAADQASPDRAPLYKLYLRSNGERWLKLEALMERVADTKPGDPLPAGPEDHGLTKNDIRLLQAIGEARRRNARGTRSLEQTLKQMGLSHSGMDRGDGQE